MARKTKSYGASFDKVGKLIQKTDSFKSLVEQIHNRIRTVRVLRVTAGYMDSGTRMRPAVFEIGFPRIDGEDTSCDQLNTKYNKIDNYQIYPGKFIRKAEQNYVLQIFKSVPSFNIAPARMETYIENNIEGWIHSVPETRDLLSAASDRLRDEMHALSRTGECEVAVKKAYEDDAVNEIRTVLLRFRNIDKSVVKRALDEFIVFDLSEINV
jgi:hypothetical protein